MTRSIPGDAPLVHDRRAKELGIKAEVAAIEVPDPYPLNPGDTIVVLRQLRNDPLARLHSHHQIDEAQYHAGRAYQRDWETAERGARAIDPTKEAVDGGKFPEPITDSQQAARKRLINVQVVLGLKMHKVAHAFLIERETIEHLALTRFSRHGQSWETYYGRMLRDALNELAYEYQLAMRPK